MARPATLSRSTTRSCQIASAEKTTTGTSTHQAETNCRKNAAHARTKPATSTPRRAFPIVRNSFSSASLTPRQFASLAWYSSRAPMLRHSVTNCVEPQLSWIVKYPMRTAALYLILSLSAIAAETPEGLVEAGHYKRAYALVEARLKANP